MILSQLRYNCWLLLL